jgi:hypothetical protein
LGTGIRKPKRFFFEKKNQKTFDLGAWDLKTPRSQEQKFFAEAALAGQARPGIFFKKATSSLA